MSTITQISPDIKVENLSDDQLLMAHMTLHAYYKEFRLGRGKEGWSVESLVETHDNVKQEIEDRDDLEHDYVSALDNESTEAFQQMDIEMGHKEDVAKEWAQGLLDSDNPEQHARDNPPKADWYVKAAEFVEQEDSTLNLSDYVSFGSAPFKSFDNAIKQWVKDVTGQKSDVVGYYFNDQTEVGALFVNQGDGYQIYVDDKVAAETDNQLEALDVYQELSRLVQDGARRDYAIDEVTGENGWEINQHETETYVNDETELKPELSQFTDGNWDDLEQEEKEDISSQFIISQSGFPADDYDDLHGRVFDQNGEIIDTNVNTLRQRNATGEVDYPDNKRDEVESKINQLQESGYENGQEEETNQMAEELLEAAGELDQMKTLDSGLDWYWYQWDQNEVEVWSRERDLPSQQGERQQDFLRIELQNPEKYDKLYRAWEGRRSIPDSNTLAGGDKPRRVVYGVTQDEETEKQAIEFLVRTPVSQVAHEAFKKLGIEEEEIRELVNE